jgi:DNA repair exonuclease SbcCD ATPase subunit
VAQDPASRLAPTQCRDLFLESLADYAQALRQHDDATLLAERDSSRPHLHRRIETCGWRCCSVATVEHLRSPARLAAVADPELPIGRGSRPQGSGGDLVHDAGGRRASSCADADEVRELAAQLSVEQQKREEATARLESARQQLESERAERARLEQQLDALKSLEEQIKNRDNDTGR